MSKLNLIPAEAIKTALLGTMFSNEKQTIKDKKYMAFQTMAGMLLTDMFEDDFLPKYISNEITNLIEAWKFAELANDEAEEGMDLNKQINNQVGDTIINIKADSADKIIKAVFRRLFKPRNIPVKYWDRYQYLYDLWTFLDTLENTAS